MVRRSGWWVLLVVLVVRLCRWTRRVFVLEGPSSKVISALRLSEAFG